MNLVRTGIDKRDADMRGRNFLDTEVDANRWVTYEIKNVEIDSSDVTKKLSELLTGSIIKTTKIVYSKNGQNFPIGFKLDGQAMSKQHELSLHFTSPEQSFSVEQIKAHNERTKHFAVPPLPQRRLSSPASSRSSSSPPGTPRIVVTGFPRRPAISRFTRTIPSPFSTRPAPRGLARHAQSLIGRPQCGHVRPCWLE